MNRILNIESVAGKNGIAKIQWHGAGEIYKLYANVIVLDCAVEEPGFKKE